ncbi:helicase [Fibrobacterales bacterium]|nr:helicase [Fibrobacterales bacterium]
MPDTPTNDLLTDFLAETEAKGITLYPAQEEAVLELLAGKNVILATPTGSGKSLVASFLHRLMLSKGLRSVYTCPIKALVNEKWLALCKEFGAEKVGLSTGDATVNHNAPILCCTAEILEQIALRDSGSSDSEPIGAVAMDEFHYYSDKERGAAWQIPLLTMQNAQFLLISATIGASDTEFFETEMTKRNGLESITVRNAERPVPLEFSYSESPLSNAVQKLLNEGKSPIYVVNFTQSEAAENAQNFTSLDIAQYLKKDKIAEALKEFRFSSPFGSDVKRWLKQGIGLHHAGLLPKYRILTEKMAQQGLLPIICGTDTLGVGVNVPIRTVLFTKLCKFNGEKTTILPVRDFHQIAGRAGRKGFDSIGYVVAQAPEYAIENKMREAKAGKTGRKFQKAQPPEHNFTNWDKNTFEKLINGEPERLISRFNVDANMILQTLSQTQSSSQKNVGCRKIHNLIINCHDTKPQKKIHIKRAIQIYRSLAQQGIIENGKLAIDLNNRFAMHQPLSLFLLETIEKLDTPAEPLNSFTLLSLIEAIVEESEMIRRRQLSRLKNEAVSEMKAQGVEFEERQARLEEMRPPEPENVEWIEGNYIDFSKKHPWVAGEKINPQVIVLEMFAESFSFFGYIKNYGLERIEGLLLRHINSVYKVLAHTVPEKHKNEEILIMQDYLREMLQRVDSSLLDEWKKMLNPQILLPEEQEEPLPPFSVSERMVKSLVLQFIVAWGKGDFAAALDCVEEWSGKPLAELHKEYMSSHSELRMDAEGRSNKHTEIKKNNDTWEVARMLQDYDDKNDWQANFTVDLSASKNNERLIMFFKGFE